MLEFADTKPYPARRAEARDMLTSIYGWFVEGFDTPDLKDACALIGELRDADSNTA